MITKLDALQIALSRFTEIYYKATINHLRVFLYIAARPEQIVNTRDLPDALQMPQTTISRTVRSMAEKSYIHEKGFGLLRLSIDPEDERQRIVELTTSGKKLVLQLTAAMDDK